MFFLTNFDSTGLKYWSNQLVHTGHQASVLRDPGMFPLNLLLVNFDTISSNCPWKQRYGLILKVQLSKKASMTNKKACSAFTREYTSLGNTWLLNMSQSSLIPKTLSPDLLQKACFTLLLSELDSPEWYWEFSLQVPLDSYNSALRISSLTQRIC